VVPGDHGNAEKALSGNSKCGDREYCWGDTLNVWGVDSNNNLATRNELRKFESGTIKKTPASRTCSQRFPCPTLSERRRISTSGADQTSLSDDASRHRKCDIEQSSNNDENLPTPRHAKMHFV
jgi:hypothetical protein